MKILIVDDQAMVREAYAERLLRLLKPHGVSSYIQEACSAQEALLVFDASFNLVLLDHRMPPWAPSLTERAAALMLGSTSRTKIAGIGSMREGNYPNDPRFRQFGKDVSRCADILEFYWNQLDTRQHSR